ncbi:MAG: hypothetical protein WB559_08865 [Candidatus Acidiferrales bacterium]
MCVGRESLAHIRSGITITPAEVEILTKVMGAPQAAIHIQFRERVGEAFDRLSVTQLPRIEKRAEKRRQEIEAQKLRDLPKLRLQRQRWEQKQRRIQAASEAL